MTYRLLILSHGHPDFSKGGGEYASYALFQQFGKLDDIEAFFIAAAPNNLDHPDQAPTIQELSVGREWLVAPTDDWLFYHSDLDLSDDSDLHHLIEQIRPDIVHVHHFFRLGVNFLMALKRWTSTARWVFTFHEFLAVCPYHGQLLTRTGKLCDGPTPADCLKCIPQCDQHDLAIRDTLMRHMLSAFDAYIAPSQQLADRYFQWGLEGHKCFVVESPLTLALDQVAWSTSDHISHHVRAQRCPTRFAFFGNVQPQKGLDLILTALELSLAECPNMTLTIFGRIPTSIPSYASDLERESYQTTFRLLNVLSDHIHLVGGYSQGEIPDLMSSIHWVVMASRWLENSPVVIQEAKACRRPLLVPALGGMAEKVTPDVDGFHFDFNNPHDLSSLMLQCAASPDQWSQLVANMTPPPSLASILRDHRQVYGLPI